MKLAELYTELTVRDAKYKASMRGARRLADITRRSVDLLARAAKYAFVGITALGAISIRNAAKQEKSEKLLKSALDATGQGLDNNFEKLKKAAAEIQKLTTVGDEAAMDLMTLGLNMGAAADQTETITRNAIGLSRALNMDLKTAMRYTILATQGETTMLARYVPAIRLAQTETEKLAAIQKTANAGWAAAQDETQTFWGQLQQLKNELGDMTEQLGFPLIEALTAAVKWLRSLGITSEDVAGAVEWFTNGLKSAGKSWLEILSYMETGWEDLGNTIELVLVELEINIRKLAVTFKDHFREVLREIHIFAADARVALADVMPPILGAGETAFKGALFAAVPGLAATESGRSAADSAARALSTAADWWETERQVARSARAGVPGKYKPGYGTDPDIAILEAYAEQLAKKWADKAEKRKNQYLGIFGAFGFGGAPPGRTGPGDLVLGKTGEALKKAADKSRSGGFTGIEQLSRNIQTELLKQQEDQIQKDQLKTQEQILFGINSMNEKFQTTWSPVGA